LIAYGTDTVAYGTDKMSKETKDVMLYGRLQEGLRLSVVKNPSVSGALSYKELCIAAKHEEKQLTEVQKHQANDKSFTTTKHRSDRQISESSASRNSKVSAAIEMSEGVIFVTN